MRKLKDHILGRLLKREFDGDAYGEFTDQDRNTVRISGERLYRCKTFRVNYTTHNIQHDGLTLISWQSPQKAHPYRYAHWNLVSSSHAGVEEKSF